MGYKAVIFDFFGTLVDQFPFQDYQRLLTDMAVALAVPAGDFTRVWAGAYQQRNAGVFATVESSIEYVYAALGVPVDSARVRDAAHIRIEWSRQIVRPRPDAVDTLARLNGAGFKVGLISNCTAEMPVLWSEMPFAPFIDIPIFSCVVGLAKPDPQIYLLACERLGAAPQDCLYVGDGDSHELTGATRVGMHPVLIPASYTGDAHRLDAEAWQGPSITKLSDVLTLVEGLPTA